ncbi:aslA [Symbiodinium pilosum]|uniref:AslA protein n=1 Tax=Symbiodinium pilosum TaxID=2952 RepID=A0A812XCB8_SYMPI|nr:aslA [Symbiodinium pilosum]
MQRALLASLASLLPLVRAVPWRNRQKASQISWFLGFQVVHDAHFLDSLKKNNKTWAAEDASLEKKLASLESKFGKKPNIIYILADDIGWGEMGWQGGGKHRGTPTEGLDKMAFDGIRFWSSYSEPSCTPSRIAIMTGRHPVRTGLLKVLWPGQTEGLSPEEFTIAEVLSTAGYHTAMWGKWHLGELPEHAPENQGFDYAYYGLFNGAPDNWPDSHDMQQSYPNPHRAMFYDFPGVEAYKEETGIDLSEAAFVGRRGQSRQKLGGAAGTLGPRRQEYFEKESIDQIIQYVQEKAKDERPFFIYWATYTQQLQGSAPQMHDPHVDPANAQASMMAAHSGYVDRLLATLRAEGIAENTLVVWFSDNGPMYAFFPNSGYSWLRGGKGTVLEGGVRVPAMAWWPGTIQPNQDPVDMIHLTDLYTTAARLGGALAHVPEDRVVDGVDQVPLLLLGEGHGRRSTMFHYSGSQLGAIRHKNFKIHLKESKGGLPGMDFYNVKRDPGEKYGEFYPGLFAVTPVQQTLQAHKRRMQEFPNRGEQDLTGSCPPHA